MGSARTLRKRPGGVSRRQPRPVCLSPRGRPQAPPPSPGIEVPAGRDQRVLWGRRDPRTPSPGRRGKRVCRENRGGGEGQGETPEITDKNQKLDLSVRRESIQKLPVRQSSREMAAVTPVVPGAGPPGRSAGSGRAGARLASVSIRRSSDCFALGSSFIGQY